MFKKSFSIAIVVLCLGLIGCTQSSEPIPLDDPNINYNDDAPYRGKFINITYKGKEYLVAADYVCLAFKGNHYFNNDVFDKIEKDGYEIISSKPHYLRLLLRTDGKQHILKHYYKFEKEEYVEEVLPYVAVTKAL
jgi:hypothetical protein